MVSLPTSNMKRVRHKQKTTEPSKASKATLLKIDIVPGTRYMLVPQSVTKCTPYSCKCSTVQVAFSLSTRDGIILQICCKFTAYLDKLSNVFMARKFLEIRTAVLEKLGSPLEPLILSSICQLSTRNLGCKHSLLLDYCVTSILVSEKLSYAYQTRTRFDV